MNEPRMDGTAYEAALFRIAALREALIDVRSTTGIVAARRYAENALTSDDERHLQQRSKEADEASYADLRASGGIVGAP